MKFFLWKWKVVEDTHFTWCTLHMKSAFHNLQYLLAMGFSVEHICHHLQGFNDLGSTPPGSIAPPVFHVVILPAWFEHLNWILLSRKEIQITNKEQKRQASMFWFFFLICINVKEQVCERKKYCSRFTKGERRVSCLSGRRSFRTVTDQAAKWFNLICELESFYNYSKW